MVLFLLSLGLNAACLRSSLGIIDCLGAMHHGIVGSLRLFATRSLAIRLVGWLNSSFLPVKRKHKQDVPNYLVHYQHLNVQHDHY